jgi:hypothetical protein
MGGEKKQQTISEYICGSLQHSKSWEFYLSTTERSLHQLAMSPLKTVPENSSAGPLALDGADG